MNIKILLLGISHFFFLAVHAEPVLSEAVDPNIYKELSGVTLTADEQRGCVNGHRKIDYLVNQYEAAKTSPIYKLIMESTIKSNVSTDDGAGLSIKCERCDAAIKLMSADAMENVKHYTQVRNRINTECANFCATAHSGVLSNAILCKSSKPRPFCCAS